MTNDTFTLTFDCEFMRDGNTCYEVMTVQLPIVYEDEAQSKGTAIAVESAVNSIKAKQGYDNLLKMTLKEWKPDKDNDQEN